MERLKSGVAIGSYRHLEEIRNDQTSSGSNLEAVVAWGERLFVTNKWKDNVKGLGALANELISIYDNPWWNGDLRAHAANIVAWLAASDSAILELVIGNAAHYASAQHIDDAFPYSPNAFEVLAQVKPTNERVLSYLRHVIRNDYGVAHWAASEALAASQCI